MQRANRNTELGDRASFCSQCGWARRFFPGVVDPPAECPDCGGHVISSCPSCGESVLSVMSVRCDVCDTPLREPAVAGVRIRRARRLPVVQPPAAPEGAGDSCCS